MPPEHSSTERPHADLHDMTSLDLDRAAETFAQASDFTVGVEEEFSILDPHTLELVPRYEELRALADL